MYENNHNIKRYLYKKMNYFSNLKIGEIDFINLKFFYLF